MLFQPNPGDVLNIGGTDYRVAPRPAAPGSPFVQQGQQSCVYKLVAVTGQSGVAGQPFGTDRLALKVFESRYRVPGLVQLAERFAALSTAPGLQVGKRVVLSMKRHETLLRRYPDLSYAVLMPWIEGPNWMEVIFQKKELSPEISLKLARSLARTLTEMEEQGLAHGDLSGANLIAPLLAEGAPADQYPIELVDIEQLYDPNRPRPAVLLLASAGYDHPESGGQWQPEMDRFAGAVLLAEMLGWCDDQVRAAAWGTHYFDPAELQQDSARYQLLRSVLRERWGKGVASALKQAWRSETPADCMTLGEWLAVIPSQAPSATATTVAAEASRARLEANNAAVRVLLDLARKLRKEGDLTAALTACRQAEGLYPVDADLEQDLRRQISKIARKQEETGSEAATEEPQLGKAVVAGALMAAAMPSTEPPLAAEAAPVVPPVSPPPAVPAEVAPVVPVAAVVLTAEAAPVVPPVSPPPPAPVEVAPVVPVAAAMLAAEAVPVAPPVSPPPPASAEVAPVAPVAVAVLAAEAPLAIEAAPVAPPTSAPPAQTPAPSRIPSGPEPERKKRGCCSWLLLLLLGVLLGAALYFVLVVPNGKRISGYLSVILGPSAPPVNTPQVTAPAGTIQAGETVTVTGRAGGRFGGRPPAPGETIAPGETFTGTGRSGGRFGPRPPAPGETVAPGETMTETGRPGGRFGPRPPAPGSVDSSATITETTAVQPPDTAAAAPPPTNTAAPTATSVATATPSAVESSVDQLLTQLAQPPAQPPVVATAGRLRPSGTITATRAITRTVGIPTRTGERSLPTTVSLAVTETIPSPVPGALPAVAETTSSPLSVLGANWARSADGMVMVGVPAGEFQMGSTDAHLDAVLALCKDSGGNCNRTTFTTEQPTHTVTLDAFWIDDTEVTNAQFAAFLSAEGEGARAPNLADWVDLNAKESRLEKAGNQYQAKQQYANHPVVLVSWEGANAYCQWAGAQLPTEAQWEYVARGPQGSVFPWGNEFSAKLLNYSSETDGYTETAPVGSFYQGASWNGALDMAGNVAEWVADYYGPYLTGRQSNPVGPANGDLRVTRGGSYLVAPYYARGASRGAVNSSDSNRGLGFRCAKIAQVPRTGKVPSEHAG